VDVITVYFIVYSRLSNIPAIRRLSPLQDYKSRPMLYLCFLAVKVLLRVTPAVTRDLGLYTVSYAKHRSPRSTVGFEPATQGPLDRYYDPLTVVPRGQRRYN
jgi:hypothetical protein